MEGVLIRYVDCKKILPLTPPPPPPLIKIRECRANFFGLPASVSESKTIQSTSVTAPGGGGGGNDPASAGGRARWDGGRFLFLFYGIAKKTCKVILINNFLN